MFAFLFTVSLPPTTGLEGVLSAPAGPRCTLAQQRRNCAVRREDSTYQRHSPAPVTMDGPHRAPL